MAHLHLLCTNGLIPYLCYLDAVVAAISYDDVAAFFVKDKPLWIQKLTWV
jgi:hypothetical protein